MQWWNNLYKEVVFHVSAIERVRKSSDYLWFGDKIFFAKKSPMNFDFLTRSQKIRSHPSMCTVHIIICRVYWHLWRSNNTAIPHIPSLYRTSTQEKKNNCGRQQKKNRKEIKSKANQLPAPVEQRRSRWFNWTSLSFHHIFPDDPLKLCSVRRSHFTSINKQKNLKKLPRIASRQWWCLIRRWFKFFFFVVASRLRACVLHWKDK